LISWPSNHHFAASIPEAALVETDHEVAGSARVAGCHLRGVGVVGHIVFQARQAAATETMALYDQRRALALFQIRREDRHVDIDGIAVDIGRLRHCVFA